MRLYARTISEILSELATVLGDASANWSTARQRVAINRSIRDHAVKVFVPGIYTMPSNYESNTYEYAIPNWMDPATMIPQQRRLISDDYGYTYDINNAYTWVDIPAFEVERAESGQYYFRLQFNPNDEQGRIKYWMTNTPAPTTDPALTSNLTSSDTSLTLTGVIATLQQSGFVQVENEVIQYAGVTLSGGNTVLGSLTRGACGTEAAAHTTPLTVYFAYAVDEQMLFNALQYQALAYLHEMYLNESAARNQKHHQEMIAYYKQSAAELLRAYVPAVSPRFTLDRRGEAL